LYVFAKITIKIEYHNSLHHSQVKFQIFIPFSPLFRLVLCGVAWLFIFIFHQNTYGMKNSSYFYTTRTRQASQRCSNVRVVLFLYLWLTEFLSTRMAARTIVEVSNTEYNLFLNQYRPSPPLPTPFSVFPTPFTPLNWGRRRNLVLGF